VPATDPLPEPVRAAVDRVRGQAATIRALEDDLDRQRHAYYDLVGDAVDAARAAGIATAQAAVARALGVSRQRVSELARRTPAAN
jgi:hypothetical protein